MDVEMPVMNGIEATERIMAESPTPVLMLSAHTDENADVTFEALDTGAVDFFTKPGGEVSMEMSRREASWSRWSVLSRQSMSARRAAAARQQRQRTAPTTAGGSATTGEGPEARRPTTYVANPTLVIGSSTGGPKMVEPALEASPRGRLPRARRPAHAGRLHGRFAARLDRRCDYEVREADRRRTHRRRRGIVAAGDRHMEVKNYRNGRLRTKSTQDERSTASVRAST